MSLRTVAQAFVTAVWGTAAFMAFAFAWTGRVAAAGGAGAVCVAAGIVTAIVRRPRGGAT
jgi:hypothetical protein